MHDVMIIWKKMELKRHKSQGHYGRARDTSVVPCIDHHAIWRDLSVNVTCSAAIGHFA